MATILSLEDFTAFEQRFFSRLDTLEARLKKLEAQQSERGYSVAQIAQKLNVAHSTVYSYTNLKPTAQHYLKATKNKGKTTIMQSDLDDYLKRNSNDGKFNEERVKGKIKGAAYNRLTA